MKPRESRMGLPVVFFGGVNKKVEILLCVCCLGFQGGGRCLGLCELEAEIAGSEGGGIQGEDFRVPGEEGCWGRVQDGTPSHPQTSAGTFGALGFCAPVICHEKDVNQGVTVPEGSGTAQRRTRVPSQTGAKPTSAQPETEPPQIPTNT